MPHRCCCCCEAYGTVGVEGAGGMTDGKFQPARAEDGKLEDGTMEEATGKIRDPNIFTIPATPGGSP